MHAAQINILVCPVLCIMDSWGENLSASFGSQFSSRGDIDEAGSHFPSLLPDFLALEGRKRFTIKRPPLVTSNRKPVCDVRYLTGLLKYGGRQALYGLISIFWVEGEVLLLVRLDKGCRCKVARGQKYWKNSVGHYCRKDFTS
ncbi:hypothetical protein CDAR_564381 [Caerostris darwini]|uniref:Uncharacterized protein n=1 Tax=Caerostris darwini TaxID=1538125 RepID=A0AAV4THV6_9ARAC|nr:hypothetical protein CDAR_564381 [Caerostris darwini]